MQATITITIVTTTASITIITTTAVAITTTVAIITTAAIITIMIIRIRTINNLSQTVRLVFQYASIIKF